MLSLVLFMVLLRTEVCLSLHVFLKGASQEVHGYVAPFKNVNNLECVQTSKVVAHAWENP
jgi:hypothetical protein